MLVIQPIGGADDWRALFHEAGHTEHFAHTSPDLSMEEKRLGDNAVTEGWAMLMRAPRPTTPAWLARRLDFPRPDEFAAEGAARAALLRPPLLREAPLRARVPRAPTTSSAMRQRYVEILGDALKIEPSADRLPRRHRLGLLRHRRTCARGRSRRSCATTCASEFGTDWFARREAGSLLRELWAEGQRPTADELLKDVTGAELEMAAVGDRVRERLG